MTFRIEALSKYHDRKGFDCGEESLNTFLRQFARQNDEKGLGRTYVAVKEGDPKIYGYYTLSSNSIGFETVPDKLPRYPVPVIHLGRLAVVPGQQREVQLIEFGERFEQLARPRHQALVTLPRMLNLLRQQRQVGVAEAVMVLRRVGQACLLQRLRHEEGIRAAAERLALERLGDAERRREGPRHGAQAGAPAQEVGPEATAATVVGGRPVRVAMRRRCCSPTLRPCTTPCSTARR